MDVLTRTYANSSHYKVGVPRIELQWGQESPQKISQGPGVYSVLP